MSPRVYVTDTGDSVIIMPDGGRSFARRTIEESGASASSGHEHGPFFDEETMVQDLLLFFVSLIVYGLFMFGAVAGFQVGWAVWENLPNMVG